MLSYINMCMEISEVVMRCSDKAERSHALQISRVGDGYLGVWKGAEQQVEQGG